MSCKLVLACFLALALLGACVGQTQKGRIDDTAGVRRRKSPHGLWAALQSVGKSLMPLAAGQGTPSSGPATPHPGQEPMRPGHSATQSFLQLGLTVPPFEQLPSMAPYDGLDENLVNPLKNPKEFKGPNQQLPVDDPRKLPSASSLVPHNLGKLAPTVLMTPGGSLPPLHQTGGSLRSNVMTIPGESTALPYTPPYFIPPVKPMPSENAVTGSISSPGTTPATVAAQAAAANAFRFRAKPAAKPAGKAGAGAKPGGKLPEVIPPKKSPTGPAPVFGMPMPPNPSMINDAIGTRLPPVDPLSMPISTSLGGQIDPSQVPSLNPAIVQQLRLSPPNLEYLNPVNKEHVTPNGVKDPYFDYVQAKHRFGKMRTAMLRLMEARKKKMEHLKAYIDGGDAWIQKMEDQLSAWLRQERERGSASIKKEKNQVGKYKQALKKLQSLQKSDAMKVNAANAKLRRAKYKFQLEQRQKRLKEAEEHERHLQQQTKLTASKKAAIKAEMAKMKQEIDSIQMGATTTGAPRAAGQAGGAHPPPPPPAHAGAANGPPPPQGGASAGAPPPPPLPAF